MTTHTIRYFFAACTLTLSSYGWLAREQGTGNVMSAVIDSFDHNVQHEETEAFGDPNSLYYKWDCEYEVSGQVYLNWADDTDVIYAYSVEFQWLGISPPVITSESDFVTSSNMHDVIPFGPGGKGTKLNWDNDFYIAGPEKTLFFVTSACGVTAISWFYSGNATVAYLDNNTETVYL